ncbi:MAG: molybdenum cofactor synthesis domain-containing protein [Methanobacteriota archaeon]
MSRDAHRTRHRGGHRTHPRTPLVPFDRALRIALDAVRPIERTETVPVPDAAGRVAAEGVRARIDVPLVARAAMDGYAVIARDTYAASPASPVRLRRLGSVHAGGSFRGRAARGRCVEVATGASLPAGTDAVVIVERTARRGPVVEVHEPARRGDNVSPRGGDIRRGSVVVGDGDVLTPARVGALSAVGRTRVRVYARPRVAIFTTGDEVVPPGRRIRPGQVYDVNSRTLSSVVRANGSEPVVLGSAGDRLAALRSIVDRAARADLVVSSGGSSVGSRDLVADLVAERGRLLFHGIALKPGRPTVLGVIGRTPMLGMPGYPTSCLTNAYVLMAPMLRRMARLPPEVPRSVDVPVAQDLESPRGKVEFHTVRIVRGRAVSASRGSSAITSMAHADGFVEIPANVTRIRRGDRVRVVLF